MQLQDRAADNLRFIRDTMERAGTFTAVPGYGGLLMGVAATIVGVQFIGQPVDQDFLKSWLFVMALALPIGAVAMAWKARRAGSPLFTGVGRKFLLAYIPPVLAGGVLTLPLWRAGEAQLLPATWLLLYGAGVIAGGMTSIRAIPVMGACFFALGTAAAVVPEHGALLMVLGFGALQIGFGALIGWRHGG